MLPSLAGALPCAESCIGQSAWAVEVVAIGVEEWLVCTGIGAPGTSSAACAVCNGSPTIS